MRGQGWQAPVGSFTQVSPWTWLVKALQTLLQLRATELHPTHAPRRRRRRPPPPADARIPRAAGAFPSNGAIDGALGQPVAQRGVDRLGPLHRAHVPQRSITAAIEPRMCACMTSWRRAGGLQPSPRPHSSSVGTRCQAAAAGHRGAPAGPRSAPRSLHAARLNMSSTASNSGVPRRPGAPMPCAHSRAIARRSACAIASSVLAAGALALAFCPGGSGCQEVSSSARWLMRCGARAHISKATRPPIEWPATASGPAAPRAAPARPSRPSEASDAVSGTMHSIRSGEGFHLRGPHAWSHIRPGKQQQGGRAATGSELLPYPPRPARRRRSEGRPRCAG